MVLYLTKRRPFRSFDAKDRPGWLSGGRVVVIPKSEPSQKI
jgi:hypothetical protein